MRSAAAPITGIQRCDITCARDSLPSMFDIAIVSGASAGAVLAGAVAKTVYAAEPGLGAREVQSA